MAVIAVLVLSAVVASATALAPGDPAEDESRLPSSADVLAAIESETREGTGLPELTDPAAAEGVPLQDLQRGEALEVLSGVFEEPVEAAAGIYDELQGATPISSHVVVLPEGDAGAEGDISDEEPNASPQEAGPTGSPEALEGDEAPEAMPEVEARAVEGPPPKAPAEIAHAALVDSTIPLQVGEGETLDLGLERREGNLEPVAPLIETRIPGELNEAIELPGVGIGIKLDDVAEERSASISGGSVAFYPNVAEDADLAVSPTPTGVETLFQLRGADSPHSESYHLSLPSGATLVATEAGGAEVRSGEEVLLSVPAPTAIDASGKAVPASLKVAGSSLEVGVEPGKEAQLPILVDPLFQTYEWAAKNTAAGICSNSIKPEQSNSCDNREEWGYELISHFAPPHLRIGGTEPNGTSIPGINIVAEQQQTLGDHATVLYTVPRYFKESPVPTSYIKSLKFSDLDWVARGQYGSPYLFMGIWDSNVGNWVSYFAHTGQAEHGIYEPAHVYEFNNSAPDTHAKAAEVGIFATEAAANSNATAYVGAATVELGDQDAPAGPIPVPQAQWVNTTAPPIGFTASDMGLGVYSISASTEARQSSGAPLHTWKALNGCIGVGDSACPRTWKSSDWNSPQLTYEPAVLPSGIDYIELTAEDPVGNKSSSSWEEVRVDHIAPELLLSGSLTEQESLGTRRASYTLKATGADGNTEHPQSGIAKAEVKLDGKAVAMEGKQAEEWSPKCTTENCPLAAEWTLNTAGLAEGKHTVEVIATDAVGLSTTKTLTIETHAATAPSLTLSGSMTEQATLGTSRPRYTLKAKSSAMAAGFEAPTLGAAPTYTSSIGSFGQGNGQFEASSDVAADGSGDVWVLDRTLNRLQEFNEKGEWLRKTGAGGTGAGKLSSPSALATDSQGNVWVADTADNRIVEFNEKGEFVETFGSNVNKTKVEAAGTEAERNLCTAASGDVCQAATAGSAAGQLKSPKGIAVTSGGNLWVADTANNRIEKFSPSGTLFNNVSGEGSEPGRLKEPLAITVAPDGSIWVADTANNRIEQWSSSLSFVRAVGKEGTGNGEFKGPSAIEADSAGDIWVGDRNNNRIEEFDEFGTYLGKFGSAGSGSGQFSMSAPMGITVDPKGSIWVTDGNHFRVQHWTIPGFPVYSSSVGSYGSGNGQFMHLAGLASDGNKGHVWALDQELDRLQEFNEKGEWLRSAGSKGSGAGQLSAPAGLASNGLGNVWVADTGNNRVVEFNEKGEFVETFGSNVNKTKVDAAGTEAEKNLCTAASGNVCQAANAGSAAGQLNSPKGIAVTSGGNLWVADTGNSRIEKFTPGGALLNNNSGEGSEPGKLKEPAAIAVAPDGSIWVADTGNNRIEQWNSSLSFVRAVGKEGSGGGEFKTPATITADASGNIWVGDQKDNRVEEFGEGGRYFGQFGADGSGKFSFTAPMGIAVDNGGSVWVADPGHAKIQRWSQETPRSEITTTIWMDNVQKTTLHGTCKTAGCTIEPQWTLESTAYATGAHTARVKTTDGLGRSTESTLNIQIARDTTKPALEASGELVNAPEGWVEQESYGLNATATDGGYGVTSISFKIDVQQVASVSQSCPEGGCKETLSKQISMASYAGGAHAAEIIATDGAGNSTVKKWTINVDPEGHISTKEAEATLEAVETTTKESPVAPTKELLEPEQVELGDNPGLQQVGSQITSTGVPDISSMSTNPAAGFTISSPYGATTVLPVVSETASSTSIAEGVAGVSANVRNGVDSVIRPEYNGVETFQAIRSDTSPDKFSWSVHLYEGQTLRLVDSDHAEVVYESGKVAFLITTEQAHDATGKEVPTSLEVSGDVLTLYVEIQKAAFVYPVIAGAGWETSYWAPILIEGPADELEIKEREQAEHEGQEGPAPPPPASEHFTLSEAQNMLRTGSFAEIIPAPAPPEAGEASASSIKQVKPFRVCQEDHCSIWHVELYNPSYHYKHWYGTHWSAHWEEGTEVKSTWYYNGIYTPELNVEGYGCGFTGSSQVFSGQHEHLTIWGRYMITATAFTPDGGIEALHNYLALQIWVWPNGYQQRIEKHWDPTPEALLYEGCR